MFYHMLVCGHTAQVREMKCMRTRAKGAGTWLKWKLNAFLIWAFLRRCSWARSSASALQKWWIGWSQRTLFEAEEISLNDAITSRQGRLSPLNNDELIVHSEPGKSAVNRNPNIFIPVPPFCNLPTPSQKINQSKINPAVLKWWPQDTSVYL